MRRYTNILTPLAIVLGLARAGAAADVEVNTCGQTYAGRGYLAADLDCGASSGSAIIIESGSLDLRGFTFTAPASLGSRGIFCEQNCRITSEPPGGTITGANRPIRAEHGLRMSDVVITDSFNEISAGTKLRLERVNVDNVEDGVTAPFRVLIIDSSITGGTFGQVSTVVVKLVNSSITGTLDPNSRTVSFSRAARLFGSTVSDNAGDGVHVGAGELVQRVTAVDSFVENNGGTGIGLDTIFGQTKIKLERTSVTNNGLHGLASKMVKVHDSTITGNGTDADCGVVQTCADIASAEAPSIDAASTCNTSYQLGSGFPGTNWGVCSLD